MIVAIKRFVEVSFLSLLVFISLAPLCWGPPLPPAGVPNVPAVNPIMSAITIAVIAGVGFYKSRK